MFEIIAKEAERMNKEYVSVTAKFDSDGNIIPLFIHWKDGRAFTIERVTDVRYAAAPRSGSAGIRYTCRIMSHEKYLFLDENRWFVECAAPQ